jgi:predicted porin
MYGGLLKSASALAILAAAGLYGVNPASAADLGGDCCADLEERVAELEATTARKGNRKVSLTISGQISQQLMFWDDGIQSDVYVSGPTQSNSRWRMLGSAKISPEITAGFLYELEAFASQSTSQNQSNGGGMTVLGGTGDDAGGAISLREAMAWIEHSRLGRVSLGHGSTAANNIILIDLSGKGMAASNDVRLHSAGMQIAQENGAYSNAVWRHFFQGSSGDWLNERNEHIQYRTPTFAGFTLGVSAGEDNYWDAALRYAGEFNGIRIAGGIGYSVRSEYNGPAGAFACATNCDKELRQLAGSLSIRHMPTGLFFTGAAGDRDMKDDDLGGDFSSSFFYLSGGIARNFFGIGDTVLYGEYSEWKGNAQDTFIDATSSDKLTHWGVGVVQHVDAAAMEFWLAYKNYSLSGDCLICGGGPAAADAQDLHLVLAGTRIRF